MIVLFGAAFLWQWGVWLQGLAVGKTTEQMGRKHGVFALVGALLLTNGVAMVLALAGCFSIGLLSAILLAADAVASLWERGKGLSLSQWRQVLSGKPVNWWLAGILVILGGLYLAFPTEYLTGVRDPGIYIIHGVNIAETGSFSFAYDGRLEELYQEYGDLISPGYPVLYTSVQYPELGTDVGEVSAHFMPMYSSLLAIGYGLGGMAFLLRVNAVLGILALLLFYYFVKEFFFRRAAIPVLILGLNPAQLWGARIAETELLAQLLFFAALYLWMTGWRDGKNRYLVWAGFLLGYNIFNRIDMMIVGLGFLVAAAYGMVWHPKKRKSIWGSCAAYLLIMGAACLCLYWFSPAYYILHIGNNALQTAWLVNGIGFGLLIIASVVSGIWKEVSQEKYNIIHKLTDNCPAQIGWSVLFALAFVYLYWIRSDWGRSTDFNKTAIIEYCWYVSVPLFLLMLAGIVMLLAEKKREADLYYAFLCMGMVCVAAYLISPSITADHIWAARRWVSVNFPVTVLLGCYGWQFLWNRYGRKWKRVGIYAGTAALTGFLVWQCRTFLLTPMLGGLDEQYQELAANLDDDTVYLAWNNEIASILRYVYGKQVYQADATATEELVRYIEENGELNFVGDFPLYQVSRMDYQKEVEHYQTLSGLYLEAVMGEYPDSLYRRYYNGTVGKIYYQPSDRVNLQEGDLVLQAADYDAEGNIVALEEGGVVFYGPYAYLEEGTYRVTLKLEQNEGYDATYVEIGSAEEPVIVERQQVDSGETVLEFQLDEPVSGWEIRLQTGGGSGLICRQVILEKLS